MVNNTIVKTYSKRQSTVESSTYGSELVAARVATDMAVEIRYTLQMLGVPIDGSVLMLGDNKSVVLNTTVCGNKLCVLSYRCCCSVSNRPLNAYFSFFCSDSLIFSHSLSLR